MSAIAAELPPNIKLVTVSSNYKEWNEGKLLIRFAHMYSVDEHETLSQPATFSLTDVFAKTGLKVTAATETMLTGNQERAAWEAKKLRWNITEVVDRGVSTNPQDVRVFFDQSDASMSVTMSAMEVKTFLVTVA